MGSHHTTKARRGRGGWRRGGACKLRRCVACKLIIKSCLNMLDLIPQGGIAKINIFLQKVGWRRAAQFPKKNKGTPPPFSRHLSQVTLRSLSTWAYQTLMKEIKWNYFHFDVFSVFRFTQWIRQIRLSVEEKTLDTVSVFFVLFKPLLCTTFSCNFLIQLFVRETYANFSFESWQWYIKQELYLSAWLERSSE